MPAGDRTGPENMGARTGRGAGYCAGYDMPGYANYGYPRGFRQRTFRHGRFGGLGFHRWNRWPMHGAWYGRGAYPGAFAGAFPPPAPMTAEEELEALKAEEKWLQEQLEAVRGRMKKE